MMRFFKKAMAVTMILCLTGEFAPSYLRFQPIHQRPFAPKSWFETTALPPMNLPFYQRLRSHLVGAPFLAGLLYLILHTHDGSRQAADQTMALPLIYRVILKAAARVQRWTKAKSPIPRPEATPPRAQAVDIFAQNPRTAEHLRLALERFPEIQKSALRLAGNHAKKLYSYIREDGSFDLRRFFADHPTPLRLRASKISAVHHVQGLIRLLDLEARSITVVHNGEVGAAFAAEQFANYSLSGDFANAEGTLGVKFHGNEFEFDEEDRVLIVPPHATLYRPLPRPTSLDERKAIRDELGLSEGQPVIVIDSASREELDRLATAFIGHQVKPLLVLIPHIFSEGESQRNRLEALTGAHVIAVRNPIQAIPARAISTILVLGHYASPLMAASQETAIVDLSPFYGGHDRQATEFLNSRKALLPIDDPMRIRPEIMRLVESDNDREELVRYFGLHQEELLKLFASPREDFEEYLDSALKGRPEKKSISIRRDLLKLYDSAAKKPEEPVEIPKSARVQLVEATQQARRDLDADRPAAELCVSIALAAAILNQQSNEIPENAASTSLLAVLKEDRGSVPVTALDPHLSVGLVMRFNAKLVGNLLAAGGAAAFCAYMHPFHNFSWIDLLKWSTLIGPVIGLGIFKEIDTSGFGGAHQRRTMAYLSNYLKTLDLSRRPYPPNPFETHSLPEDHLVDADGLHLERGRMGLLFSLREESRKLRLEQAMGELYPHFMRFQDFGQDLLIQDLISEIENHAQFSQYSERLIRERARRRDNDPSMRPDRVRLNFGVAVTPGENRLATICEKGYWDANGLYVDPYGITFLRVDTLSELAIPHHFDVPPDVAPTAEVLLDLYIAGKHRMGSLDPWDNPMRNMMKYWYAQGLASTVLEWETSDPDRHRSFLKGLIWDFLAGSFRPTIESILALHFGADREKLCNALEGIIEDPPPMDLYKLDLFRTSGRMLIRLLRAPPAAETPAFLRMAA